MATRAHHDVTVVGCKTVTLTGEYAFVKVVNWGTAVINVAAGSQPFADIVALQDDTDVVAIGGTEIIQVSGTVFDPGQPGTAADGTVVKVACAAAASGFSVVGLNG